MWSRRVIEYFTLQGKQRNIHVYDENEFPSKWFHMGVHGNQKNIRTADTENMYMIFLCLIIINVINEI